MGTRNKLDVNDISNWPSIEEIEHKIAKYGAKYTANVWMTLQCKKNLVLTPGVAERYKIVQRAHIRLTGNSLPDTIKGAIKTRAQIRDDLGTVDEDKIEKSVQGGLMAKLKEIREGKKQ